MQKKTIILTVGNAVFAAITLASAMFIHGATSSGKAVSYAWEVRFIPAREPLSPSQLQKVALYGEMKEEESE